MLSLIIMGIVGFVLGYVAGVMKSEHISYSRALIARDAVTKFWIDHYTTKTGKCLLCKERGVISVGINEHYYCGCPRGQDKRNYIKGVI